MHKQLIIIAAILYLKLVQDALYLASPVHKKTNFLDILIIILTLKRNIRKIFSSTKRGRVQQNTYGGRGFFSLGDVCSPPQKQLNHSIVATLDRPHQASQPILLRSASNNAWIG